MDTAPIRSRSAREAAERALVRVAHHYGRKPEFVVLGGLVPQWLCSKSESLHAGTTDIDVQVDLQIAHGATDARKLEHALHNAEFSPKDGQCWCWIQAAGGRTASSVKFELLTDDNGTEAGNIIKFKTCDRLGVINLRGTGFASRDIEVRELSAQIGGVAYHAEVNVSGLAGFLFAKVAAAFSRRQTKDWYDIAFVLLHNNAGGPEDASRLVKKCFAKEIAATCSAINDLRDNFADPNAQGSQAYAQQMRLDYPELDSNTLAADAVHAVQEFCRGLKN